jgi:hypothetical protein
MHSSRASAATDIFVFFERPLTGRAKQEQDEIDLNDAVALVSTRYRDGPDRRTDV